MSPLILYQAVENATSHLILTASSTTIKLVVSTTSSPEVQDSSFLTRLSHFRFDPMNDYLLLSQNIFLIVSNFFMLPAIFLAIRFRFRGEAVVYVLTMLASSFYHLCDNSKVKYCLVKYETLQFLDFYCAIMTLWVTAIVLANVPTKWTSSYQLGGSAFFAFLLRNNSVGVLTFVIPAFCSISLLIAYWGHKFYTERQLPTILHTRYFIAASVFTFAGIILFAIQQHSALISLYGYTHSSWHVCMSLAITFLLPNRNGVSLFYYRGKRYSLDDNITQQDTLAKRDDDYEHGARDNIAFHEDPTTRLENICHHI